jgi:RNA-binding protein
MNEMIEQEPSPLSSRQKKYLKGLGHALTPLVLIGKEGISPGLIAATALELLRHELIKVKVGNNSGLEKNETARVITAATGSSLVQLIGKTMLLYKKNPTRPKKERIILPTD